MAGYALFYLLVFAHEWSAPRQKLFAQMPAYIESLNAQALNYWSSALMKLSSLIDTFILHEITGAVTTHTSRAAAANALNARSYGERVTHASQCI